MASNTSDALLPTYSHDEDRFPQNPYDVLDGQGRRARDGNKYYRSIMRLFKRDQDYIKKSDSMFKKRIAQAIYDHVICKGGRFRKGNEIKSEEDSIKKITQSLRDYSRDDRHVYNNQDEVDESFPEIKEIEKEVSKHETFDKQYKVAIEELKILTEKTVDQKRKPKEDVEGTYVPYSKNPFLPTSTGYDIDQNLTRSKKTTIPPRLHLSNSSLYETYDAFGNKTWGRYGMLQKLIGELDPFSQIELLINENLSTYTLYRPASMNTANQIRAVAKGVFFAIQACRKRNLVASLAHDFNEFLQKHVPPKAGFPRIVVLPCVICDGNILVEKRLNEEKWEEFTMQPQKKMGEILPSLSPIPNIDFHSLFENTSLSDADEMMTSSHDISITDAFSEVPDETILSPSSFPTEEAGKQYFTLEERKFDANEIIYIFMAFAFIKTDRQVAIYKLKGSLDCEMNPITYELTNPSIHTSRNHHTSFGDDDEGQLGIEKFVKLIEPYEQLLRKYIQQENIDTLNPGVFEA